MSICLGIAKWILSGLTPLERLTAEPIVGDLKLLQTFEFAQLFRDGTCRIMRWVQQNMFAALNLKSTA